MGNGSKGPRPVTVNVVIDSIERGEFHFETSDLPMESHNVLVFDNTDDYSGFTIDYVLQNSGNYKFPNSLGHALWVRAGSKINCPETRQTWGQFKADSVSDDGLTLTVDNKNDKVRDFAYTLRITDGQDWVDLDPGGMNRNGGGEPPSALSSSSTLIAMGAGAGALVGVAYVALSGADMTTEAAAMYGVGGAILGALAGLLIGRM